MGNSIKECREKGTRDQDLDAGIPAVIKSILESARPRSSSNNVLEYSGCSPNVRVVVRCSADFYEDSAIVLRPVYQSRQA
jgi:hypothetical protein